MLVRVFSISREPSTGDNFRPECVRVFSYTRKCDSPAVKHGQNAMAEYPAILDIATYLSLNKLLCCLFNSPALLGGVPEDI